MHSQREIATQQKSKIGLSVRNFEREIWNVNHTNNIKLSKIKRHHDKSVTEVTCKLQKSVI